jgi:2-hydroxycyclohexanecarboxyl-CoA dehydrogenase
MSVAVVTGAGGSIGREIALELSASGRSVAVMDFDNDAANSTVESVRKQGGIATAYVVDIRKSEQVIKAAAKIDDELGRPSVLVNCAGWDSPGRFDQSTETTWRNAIDINYFGLLVVTSAFLDFLKLAEPPRSIVSISSDAARVGSSQEAVYSGAKAAVIGFSKALAREVARDQITVNCVAPGPTDSPMLSNLDPDVLSSMVRSIPLRRIASPSDIARAVGFFTSSGATYITGQVLSVSGGLTMVD